MTGGFEITDLEGLGEAHTQLLHTGLQFFGVSEGELELSHREKVLYPCVQFSDIHRFG
ncbi:hypothetical protein ES708_18116 [subsurface metagenome]